MDYVTAAYVLIGIGFLFLIAELVLPTGGILFGLALVLQMLGVLLIFTYGDTTTGLIALGGAFVLLPLAGLAMVCIWPRTPLARSLIEKTTMDDSSVASMPGVLQLEELRGRIGRVISPLRPSGLVEFDGRRIDAMTEGMMLNVDQWVRCIDVKAGRVIVRAVEKPSLTGLEDTNFEV